MRPLHLLVLAAAAVPVACEKPAASAARPAALARVGAMDILPADLLAEAKRRSAADQPVPDKEALLREMVLEEAMVQRALALNLDRIPEVRETWRSLLIGTLKRQELELDPQAVAVSPDEVRAYYDSHQADFALPEKGRLGLIFAAVPPVAPAEQVAPVRARIEEARTMAAASPDGFSQAAAKHSEHQGSRFNKGDIGWIMRGKSPTWLPASVAETAFSLEVGTTSGVIEAKGGFYLVKLLEHAPAGIRPLAQVEPSIRTALTNQRQESRRRDFEGKTLTLAGVQTWPDLLKQTQLPVPDPVAPEPPAVPGTASN